MSKATIPPRIPPTRAPIAGELPLAVEGPSTTPVEDGVADNVTSAGEILDESTVGDTRDELVLVDKKLVDFVALVVEVGLVLCGEVV
jgi:hypothetical protein